MVSIAERIGCFAQTLHKWVKNAGLDSGKRAGVPAEVAGKGKAREREVRELRQANEMLRMALAYFVMPTGSSRSAVSCRLSHPPTVRMSRSDRIQRVCRRACGRI